MLTLFLILKIFSFALLKSDYQLMIDDMFTKVEYYSISFYGCSQINLENFHFRGRPENIDNITSNNKYESYSLVYTSNYSYDSNIINKFPKSTIFIIKEKTKNMINNNESCFINLEYNYVNFETFSLYYIIINSPLNKSFIKFTLYFLIICFLTLTIFFLIFLWKKDFVVKEKLTFLVYFNLNCCIFIFFSCIFIQLIIIPNVFL